MTLEQEFDQTMRETYEAGRKRGYIAHFFLRMLEEYGGVETARRLLAYSEAQTGLYRLWELKLLHESMEAQVIKPRFRALFTDGEIAEARRRLEELGYTGG